VFRPLKRPYRIEYDGLDGLGHAGSEAGAIRAATVRIFLGQYREAVVHEAGVVIYTIRKVPQGIRIDYGRPDGPSGG
jgi:hypothetical protein